MKLWTYGGLAACLIVASGAAKAGPVFSHRAAVCDHKESKEIGHAGKGIGHGASKIYHETAKGVHKLIAKNTHDPHRKAVHMKKARVQRYEAHKEAHLSKKELKGAKQ